MTQRRARKGGETGANGERYPAGAFIATTDHAKGPAGRRKPTGRAQVEPGVWEQPPATAEGEYAWPVLGQIGGMELNDRASGTFHLNPELNPEYCGSTVERLTRISLYNDGARCGIRDQQTRQPTGRYMDRAGNDWKK